jgi:hypothetical protein
MSTSNKIAMIEETVSDIIDIMNFAHKDDMYFEIRKRLEKLANSIVDDLSNEQSRTNDKYKES